MLILYLIPFMAVAALIYEDYNDTVKRAQRKARVQSRSAFEHRPSHGDPHR